MIKDLWDLLPIRDNFYSIFNRAGKFCLAHGLRQLTGDVKRDVGTLSFRIDVTFAFP